MTGFQKFIKYAAIAFGIYLSIIIILAFLGIARQLVNHSNAEFKDLVTNEEEQHTENITKTYEGISNLEVDLEGTELIIETGDKFEIEGINISNKMEFNQEENTLKISDKKSSSSFENSNSTLKIYIPENEKLEKVDLDVKYMSVDIEKLNTANLKLDLNNNYCNINELIADNLEIDNEYADMDIANGETKKLKLDSDSGTEYINVKIIESANIDLEYSNTNIEFIDSKDNYQINRSGHFADVYVDGIEMDSNNNIFGNGNIKVDLKAMYANVNIEFGNSESENYL